jgi:hypothetical protein
LTTSTLVDRALHLVAQRAGPVNGKLRAEFVADSDGIPDAKRRVLSDLRRLGRPAGREHRMVEGLGRDHGALQPVTVQRSPDLADNLVLFRRTDRIVWHNVRVMSAPPGDPDFGVLPNHLLKSDGTPRGCVKHGLSLVGGGPLRPRDEELPPNFG